MNRQTLASLLAAAAFGAVMAAASTANGAPPTGWRPNPHDTCYQPYAACVARCAPSGSTAEQTARCESQCAAQVDPLDCQYSVHGQTATTNHPAQTAVRRP